MQTAEYCTTEDGVRIAYQVDGEGPPLLLCHWVYSFSLHSLVPTWDSAMQRLAERHSLIRYDMRGVGLSQRSVDDMSPVVMKRDIEAVVRALDLDRFTLLGVSHGGLRAIDYAVQNPKRITALILYEGYKSILDLFRREVLHALAQLSRANWHQATRTFVDFGVRKSDETVGLLVAEMMERSTSGEIVASQIESHIDYDVTPLLRRVLSPTLICQASGELPVMFEAGRRMAELIPNARMVTLEHEKDGPFNNPEEALEAIERFIATLPTDANESPNQPTSRLTHRELDVLRLIAAGKTSGEISAQLSLSIRTVGRHITNIYNKIGAHGRADATAYALRHHLLDD
jgi:pimeloyl-ACP methyl ester carboxylesterase/DNA-binding CsgD family transcriptional regulator